MKNVYNKRESEKVSLNLKQSWVTNSYLIHNNSLFLGETISFM